MRRSVLPLGMVFSLIFVIALAIGMNVVQAEMVGEFGAGWSSATPEPLQILAPRFSVDELLEIAERRARSHGLEVIDGDPEWIWTVRDNDSILSGVITLNPNTPLFTVSFRGSGTWRGIHGPASINGVTFTFNGITGDLIMAAGGYRQLSQGVEAMPEPEIIIEPRFSIEEMLELARAAARDYGLTVIDGEPEWIWTTRDSEVSGLWGDVLLNPNTPLFVVAFRGTGFWGGAGCPGCGPIPINGITLTFDGLTGYVRVVAGGYIPLTETKQVVPEPEITIEPEQTAEPQPTATHVPVTPPPNAMSEADLVAIAKDEAIFNGLETFDGPPLVAWMAREEWESRPNMQSFRVINHDIAYVVAFRGTGEDRGFGGGLISIDRGKPVKLNGFTVVLHPQDGLPTMMIGGFHAPPFATEYAEWAEIE